MLFGYAFFLFFGTGVIIYLLLEERFKQRLSFSSLLKRFRISILNNKISILSVIPHVYRIQTEYQSLLEKIKYFRKKFVQRLTAARDKRNVSVQSVEQIDSSMPDFYFEETIDARCSRLESMLVEKSKEMEKVKLALSYELGNRREFERITELLQNKIHELRIKNNELQEKLNRLHERNQSPPQNPDVINDFTPISNTSPESEASVLAEVINQKV